LENGAIIPESGPVRVWEIRKGRLAAEEMIDGRILSIQYDRAERYGVVGNLLDKRTIVINLETGGAVRLKHADFTGSALAFDAHGRYLAADHWVLSVPGWRRIAQLKRTGWVNRLAFSPKGDFLAAACSVGQNCSLRVWKAIHTFGWTRFREVGSLEHWETVNEIVFDPQIWWTFATACNDGVVRIISVVLSNDRYIVGEDYRYTHDGPVESVTFMPLDEKGNRQKRIIAAGGKDCTVREWYGTKELTRAVHPVAVEQVRYSVDRKLLITCTAQGGVYVWESNHDQPAPEDVVAASLIEELGRRLRRNLTLDEWRSYCADEPYRRTFEHLPGPSS
jgi:WD40 repeat protein